MKIRVYKKFAILLPCFVLTAMVGCKKYLEVEPVSQYNISQVFTDVTNATTARPRLFADGDDLLRESVLAHAAATVTGSSTALYASSPGGA